MPAEFLLQLDVTNMATELVLAEYCVVKVQ